MVVIFAIRLEKVFFLSFRKYDAHLLKKKCAKCGFHDNFIFRQDQGICETRAVLNDFTLEMSVVNGKALTSFIFFTRTEQCRIHFL